MKKTSNKKKLDYINIVLSCIPFIVYFSILIFVNTSNPKKPDYLGSITTIAAFGIAGFQLIEIVVMAIISKKKELKGYTSTAAAYFCLTLFVITPVLMYLCVGYDTRYQKGANATNSSSSSTASAEIAFNQLDYFENLNVVDKVL